MASFDKILDTELLHEHQGDEIEGGNIGKVIPIESIYFDKNATGANEEAMVAWNSATGHLEIGMAGGNVFQEVGSEIFVPKRVVNDDTTDMPDGTIIYISGITGVNFKVKKADYTSENTSALVIAVMTEYTAVGQKGWATSFGEVNGLNTLGETSGAVVYLGANGTWTTTKPSAPNHIVKIGNIGRVHATEGSILVSISNGWEIDELHNVAISGVADNDILQYEQSTGLWKNKPLSGTGYVVGPASSTDNNVVMFDGTTGKLIKDSGLTLSGTNTGDVTVTDSSTIDFTLTGQDITGSVIESGITHNNLSGLTTGDVHTQYALLAGRSSGQTLIGGTVANDILTLQANSATSGNTATNSAISINVGNSGATNAITILNNGNVGINKSPSEKLDVAGNVRALNSNGIADVILTSYRESPATHARFRGQASRGTESSPSGILSGDSLFGVTAQGYTSAGSFGGETAIIGLLANENFTSTAQGSQIIFQTTTNGTTTRATKMLLNNAGNVGIGTTTVPAKLNINTASTSTVGLVIQASSGQTANLTEWQNSSGTVLSSITSDGALRVSSGFNQTNYEGSRISVVSSNSLSAGQRYKALNILANITDSSPNASATVASLEQAALYSGTGTIRNVYANYFTVRNTGTGTMTTATGATVELRNTSTGTITTARGINIATIINPSGTVTTGIGIFIDNQTQATNNFAIVTNAGNIVFNEGGDASTDIRIEGDTDTNLLFTDASTDRVGIGLNNPSEKLAVSGKVKATSFIAGTSEGIDQTVTILDGDGVTTHTLTFTKGLLTGYTAV